VTHANKRTHTSATITVKTMSADDGVSKLLFALCDEVAVIQLNAIV